MQFELHHKYFVLRKNFSHSCQEEKMKKITLIVNSGSNNMGKMEHCFPISCCW